ncbi:MAG: transcriptional regulator [bacterium]
MIFNDQSPIEPIVCLAHRLEAIGNKYVFKPMGLSSTSVHILKLLHINKQLTSSDLIKLTGANKSNISQRLSFLEKEHYIKKTIPDNITDRRKITLELTSNGKEKILDLEKRMQQARISFEKKFSKEELAHHKAFFKKVAAILDNGESELNKIFKF